MEKKMNTWFGTFNIAKKNREAIFPHLKQNDMVISYQKSKFKKVNLEDWIQFLETQIYEKDEPELFYYEVVNFDIHPYQKLRFDIESKPEKMPKPPLEMRMGLITDLLNSVIDFMGRKGILISKDDFVICSSDDDVKMSYHVVLDGYKFKAEHLKKIYEVMLSRINVFYSAFIDGAVYGKTQQFRMLFNYKSPEDMRAKKFTKEFNNFRHKGLPHLITASLLGDYTNYCQIVNTDEFEDETEVVKFKQTKSKKELTVSTPSKLNEVEFDKISRAMDKKFGDKFVFNKKVDIFYWFTRTRADEQDCPLCPGKRHEKHDSFAYVYGRDILWKCGRNDKAHGLRIGTIKEYKGVTKGALDFVKKINNK
jgi:hypothetical protein